jgi:hypothetical protein
MSASQLTRITGVSHQYLDVFWVLVVLFLETGSHCVTKLRIILSMPSKCWDDRCQFLAAGS